MAETWKQWEGQVVDGQFLLRQYLGGSESCAVFLTERGGQPPEKAAIKFIPVGPSTAEAQLQRWRLAAQLSHPHLLRLFQMGRCQLGNRRLLYLLMEYAEEDLSQVLPNRPLTSEETRDMLKPVLDALAYVHGQGFVHGHVKPANIMALGDQIKISSDGLCPMGQSSLGPGGPSPYDPPERAGGAPSSRGDIWSLGMTLVEALTQRLPVSHGVEHGELVLPEDMPAPFLDIARHCLLRHPMRRWTVADVAARLQPAAAVPPRKIAAGAQRAVAGWRYAVPAIAIALAVVAVLLGPRLFNRRPQAQQAPSIPERQPAAQSVPEQRLGKQATAPSAQRISEKKQASSGTAPSPGSASGAGAKTTAGSVAPGEIFQQVLPTVPQKAADTIRGTVRVSVRVGVDPLGNVLRVTLDSPGPSKYFARLAMEAAQRWEFWPAKVDGRNVSSEWRIRFEFTRTATRAIPKSVSP